MSKHPSMQRQLAQRGTDLYQCPLSGAAVQPQSNFDHDRTATDHDHGASMGSDRWIRNVPEFKSDTLTLAHSTLTIMATSTLIGGKIYHGSYGRSPTSKVRMRRLGPALRALESSQAEKQVDSDSTPGGNHALMDWGTFPHQR